jgi:Leucine-rich repeat (LRR) protein
MVNAQNYVNKNYTDKEVKVLNLEGEDLEGHLDLSDFFNLEELNCSCNGLTGLDLSRCVNLKKLDCSVNLFSELDFLTKLPSPEKLSC